MTGQTRPLIGFLLVFIVFALYLNNRLDSIDGKNTSRTAVSGNLSTTIPPQTCTRREPYPMPPEFLRALSLIKQRADKDSVFMGAFLNCLNIQYKNLSEYGDIEGIFFFDERISSPNNLVLFVDTSYQDYDDPLTATLLIHEITHARQYYLNADLSCVEKEEQAFFNEYAFLSAMNQGELESIAYRVTYGQNLVPPLRSMKQLVELSGVAKQECGDDDHCWKTKMQSGIKSMIINEPYYQKQCDH